MAERDLPRIILAEDCETDADLAKYALRRHGIAAHVVVTSTESEFREAVSAARPDVIISDNAMPQFSGARALQIAAELATDVPFVFLSGSVAAEGARPEAFAQAVACLDKNELHRLGALVAGLLSARRSP